MLTASEMSVRRIGVYWCMAVASFFRPMSFPPPDNLLPPSNMSRINVLSGARNVVVSGAVNIAETVCEVPPSLMPRTLIDGYLSQINYNLEFSNRMTSRASIPLMPNSSTRFTGRTEILAKLQDHFAKGPNNERRSRKHFLLYGMGGIGKTQICLRFIEDMSDRYISNLKTLFN